jgi:glyoxylase-like metal-dependent hydrolase (beta-lactamase superfamily II)
VVVHHLNCATLCPLAGGRLVCHCLLIERDDGIVLVDTGLGTDEVESKRRLPTWFQVLSRPGLIVTETAKEQVRRLGLEAANVRDIVLTHMDLDHAGGVADFPLATVHVFEDEHRAAVKPAISGERRRYLQDQWLHHERWKLHSLAGDRWMGFECVSALGRGSGQDILLVPLHGHSRGHCGVAVQTGGDWLLHCGDAYFFHEELNVSRPRCTLALSILQRATEVDRAARLSNQARLLELKRERGDVRLFCAHDPLELDQFR